MFFLLGNVVIEPADGVGGWGGACTCPNGETYQVGDNNDRCDSLACVGGTSGTCNSKGGPWSNRKVICSGRYKSSYGIWENTGKN